MDAIDIHLANLAKVKEIDKAKCCPECGSTTFKQAFDGERECKGCGQSWYADVEYEPVSQDDDSRVKPLGTDEFVQVELTRLPDGHDEFIAIEMSFIWGLALSACFSFLVIAALVAVLQ